MAAVIARDRLPSRLPLWVRLAAVPLTVVFLLAGLWISAGFLAPGYDSSIAFGVGWFALAFLALRPVRKRLPELDRFVGLTYLATAVLVAFAFAWTTFRDETVNEQVVVGKPASQTAGRAAGNIELLRGSFVGLAHGASGTAAIVRLPSGKRKLTFTDLDTDNGPDLRVYLVDGPVSSDADVDDYRDVGALKGNRGNQQYSLPADLDVNRYSSVVIWCRAFTVGFAKAELQRS